LKEAFDEADRTFLDIAIKDTENGQTHDRSGSCAVALLIIDDMCYVANVGDSRAILSQNGGVGKYSLTRDHKPCDKMEQKRITDAGGKVYQNFPIGIGGKRLDLDPKYNPFKIAIPVRVLPGRLSVSRAIGDIEAKLAKFGGNPNVMIGKPEITTLKINKEHDFIFMGSDGIYDKMSNEEVISKVWGCTKTNETKDFHELMKYSVESVIKESLFMKSLDNVTGIMIAFANMETKYLETQDRPSSRFERGLNSEKQPALRKSNTKGDGLRVDDYGLSSDLGLKTLNFSSGSHHSPLLSKKVPGLHPVDERRREMAKSDIRGMELKNLSNAVLPKLNLKSPSPRG